MPLIPSNPATGTALVGFALGGVTLGTVSEVNTANTAFALFALAALGSPRTSVLVAVDSVGAPVSLGLWLPAARLATCAGFLLVLAVGDRYLATVGRLDYTHVSVVTLALLVVVAYLFAGGVGVAVCAAATALGLVPPRFGARRVHLIGVLVGPIPLGL